MMDWKLPRSGWVRVWRRTGVIIGVSSLLSLAVSEAIMLVLSQGMNLAGSVASMVEGDIGLAELFRVAVKRLYEAKRQGRNRLLMDDPGEVARTARPDD